MRVTGSMISNSIIENLNIDLARLSTLNEQVTTGRRISRPSDDPLGAQRVVNIEESLHGIDQYERNANYVTNWTAASESALSGISDVLRRANSLAVRGANDATLSGPELAALGDEINQILETVVHASNATLEGKHIFAGFQIQADAFQTTVVAGEITGVTYAGDAGVDQVEIDQGLVVNKNVTGDTIFQPGAGGVDVFGILIALRDDLRAGNSAGIQNGITHTQQAYEQVVDQVSLLGNKTNWMETASENLSAKKLGLIKLDSQLADVDMPTAIVQLQAAQNVLSAALASSAQILQQPRLFDFLQ